MTKKMNCELCNGLAKLHCESDQASLCWSCDFKVHSANFLVARHSRTLLCRVCQSPTPWTATGTKLCPTVSACRNCLRNYGEKIEIQIESDSEELEEEEDDAVDGDEEEDEEDEDNQVVPWSPTTPPPPASSSSNSNEGYDSSSSSSSSSRRDQTESRRKRRRKSVSDLCLNVNNICTLSGEVANRPPETVEEAVARGGGLGGGVEFVDSLSTIQEKRAKRRRLEPGRVGLTR
ncbi:hypothetical protein ACH5RR_028969 [Cinchona calisaya]|uniref:B box-type domain-containing protein n=1 Tax=Cinchona calisaya TaxID=153742 RepID=A0ABD2YVK5_9GENT